MDLLDIYNVCVCVSNKKITKEMKNLEILKKRIL